MGVCVSATCGGRISAPGLGGCWITWGEPTALLSTPFQHSTPRRLPALARSRAAPTGPAPAPGTQPPPAPLGRSGAQTRCQRLQWEPGSVTQRGTGNSSPHASSGGTAAWGHGSSVPSSTSSPRGKTASTLGERRFPTSYTDLALKTVSCTMPPTWPAAHPSCVPAASHHPASPSSCPSAGPGHLLRFQPCSPTRPCAGSRDTKFPAKATQLQATRPWQKLSGQVFWNPVFGFYTDNLGGMLQDTPRGDGRHLGTRLSLHQNLQH